MRTNLPVFDAWLKKQNGLFSYVPPEAGAIAFVRYNGEMETTELIHKIRKEKSVLLCPGEQFGMEPYIRFGYGEDKDYLVKALSLVEECLGYHK